MISKPLNKSTLIDDIAITRPKNMTISAPTIKYRLFALNKSNVVYKYTYTADGSICVGRTDQQLVSVVYEHLLRWLTKQEDKYTRGSITKYLIASTCMVTVHTFSTIVY